MGREGGKDLDPALARRPGARFAQADPALVRRPYGGKDGVNWYAYVGNRPTMAVDPRGLAWWSDWCIHIFGHQSVKADWSKTLPNTTMPAMRRSQRSRCMGHPSADSSGCASAAALQFCPTMCPLARYRSTIAVVRS